jgi:hypothetical protein
MTLIDLDYVHRKLAKCRYIYIGETADRGLGIFAAAAFRCGQTIVEDEDGDYFNDAISEREALRRGLDLSVHCFQVDEDRYLLPHGSIDDLINHACEPSAGIRLTRLGYRLIALRDIAVGDELTYDYSTYITSPRERLVCACGSSRCRRLIGPFRELPPALQSFYLERGVVGAFAAADAARRAQGGTRSAA